MPILTDHKPNDMLHTLTHTQAQNREHVRPTTHIVDVTTTTAKTTTSTNCIRHCWAPSKFTTRREIVHSYVLCLCLFRPAIQVNQFAKYKCDCFHSDFTALDRRARRTHRKRFANITYTRTNFAHTRTQTMRCAGFLAESMGQCPFRVLVTCKRLHHRCTLAAAIRCGYEYVVVVGLSPKRIRAVVIITLQ